MNRLIHTDVSIRIGYGQLEGQRLVSIVAMDNRGTLHAPIAYSSWQAINLSWQVFKAVVMSWFCL